MSRELWYYIIIIAVCFVAYYSLQQQIKLRHGKVPPGTSDAIICLRVIRLVITCCIVITATGIVSSFLNISSDIYNRFLLILVFYFILRAFYLFFAPIKLVRKRDLQDNDEQM